jgi:hypothetical protein
MRQWTILPFVVAAFAMGCDDGVDAGAIVGAWRSTEPTAGQHSGLSAQESGQAQATLYILFTEMGETAAGRFEFDSDWELGRDQGLFDFDMHCTRSPFGDCEPDDDFAMECRIDEAETTLSCQGGGNWSEYMFSWTKVP